jgi:hypothetical protein
MRKVLPVIVVCALLIGMFAVAPVKHVYAVVPGFDSSIQVQNLSTTAIAHITLDYYLPDGTVDTSASDSINPSSSKTYLPIHPDAGFNGSVVISSDIPIATISNLTVTATNRALGTYDGVGSGGSVLYFPLVDKRYNVSVFTIQNVGTVDASITIDFIPLPGSAFVEIADVPDTIEPGASHTFDMADYNGTTQWLGSVKVTASTSQIAGVLANVNSSTPASPTNGVYNGFNSGSVSSVLPLIMEANSGNRTGTSCQNIGPSAATITMTYFPSAGYPARAPDVYAAVPVNGMAAKVMAETGTKWIGSAVVSIDSGSELACVVNQTRPALKRSNIYEGFAPANATNVVVLPLIMSKNGTTTMAFTGFSVASFDGSDVTVTCDWLPASGYSDIADSTLGPAPILVFSQQSGFSAGNTKWIGSAICSTSGTGIFAVVNQSREFVPTGTLRDVTSAYDGFNLAP